MQNPVCQQVAMQMSHPFGAVVLNLNKQFLAQVLMLKRATAFKFWLE
jgi:hypothetical protein